MDEIYENNEVMENETNAVPTNEPEQKGYYPDYPTYNPQIVPSSEKSGIGTGGAIGLAALAVVGAYKGYQFGKKKLAEHKAKKKAAQLEELKKDLEAIGLKVVPAEPEKVEAEVVEPETKEEPKTETKETDKKEEKKK